MAVKTLAEFGAAITANSGATATALSITEANVLALGQMLTNIGQNRQDIAQMAVKNVSVANQSLLGA